MSIFNLLSQKWNHLQNNPQTLMLGAGCGLLAGLVSNKLVSHISEKSTVVTSLFVGAVAAGAYLYHFTPSPQKRTVAPQQGRQAQKTPPSNQPSPEKGAPSYARNSHPSFQNPTIFAQQTPAPSQIKTLQKSPSSFQDELSTMESRGYITREQKTELLKKASHFKTPYAFYEFIEKNPLRIKSYLTSFLILRAYDKANLLNNSITDKIRCLQQRNKISDEEAYISYQVYQIVTGNSNEISIYNQVIDKTNLSDEQKVRLKIYQETRWIANTRFSEESETLRKNTRCYIPQRPTSQPPFHATRISVKEMTTSTAALQLVSQGLNPAMLNMANAYSPGGGFVYGSQAQEEDECKKSNLYEGLEAARDRGLYPIPELGVILTPKVTFFRDDQYQFIKQPFQVDVIGSAAYDCKKQHESGGPPNNIDTYKQNTKEKMRAVMRAAIYNGNDSLVLSAFGCGAFHNDPTLISKLYKEVLFEKEFNGRFRVIVFAIINDKNGRNNLQIFQDNLGPLTPDRRTERDELPVGPTTP